MEILHVKQRHIDKANALRATKRFLPSRCCPIALAGKEQFGMSSWGAVLERAASLEESQRLCEFAADFDAKRAVAPNQFRLDVETVEPLRPAITALGPKEKFSKLAALLGGDKKSWRKVARLICKYNAKRFRLKWLKKGGEQECVTYARDAVDSLVLPRPVKDEIRVVLGLTS